MNVEDIANKIVLFSVYSMTETSTLLYAFTFTFYLYPESDCQGLVKRDDGARNQRDVRRQSNHTCMRCKNIRRYTDIFAVCATQLF